MRQLQFQPMSTAQHQQYFGASPPIPMPSAQSSNNALVPAAQGSMSAVRGKMTAPYQQSPYTPGATFVPMQGGAPRSAPAESQVGTAQHELVTIKQMKPLFQQIAKAAPHFLASGQMAKVRGEQVLGWLHQNVPGNTNISPDIENTLGMSSQDLSNYNNLQTNLITLAHQYMNAHGWPTTEQNTAAAIKAVSPGVGENGSDYVNRMSNLFNYLNKGIGNVNRNLLSGGISTTPVQNTAGNFAPTASAPVSPPASIVPQPAQSGSNIGPIIKNPSAESINPQISSIIQASGLNSAQQQLLFNGQPVKDPKGVTWMMINGTPYNNAGALK